MSGIQERPIEDFLRIAKRAYRMMLCYKSSLATQQQLATQLGLVLGILLHKFSGSLCFPAGVQSIKHLQCAFVMAGSDTGAKPQQCLATIHVYIYIFAH